MSRVILLAVLAGLAMANASPLQAQGFRVRGVTTFRYVELRPLVQDSLPAADLAGDGPFRLTPDGFLARCSDVSAYCFFRRTAGSIAAIPLVQDLQLSGWGFGEGVRLFGHFRVRGALGEDGANWPRSDDVFDALALFLELDRPRLAVRLGRQWQALSLGFNNFDGASLTLRPGPAGLSLDLFGGSSLVRGLNEPHTTQAIASMDEFPPESRALVLGAEVRARPGSRVNLGAVYQREITTDRRALYSERAGVDASLRGNWIELAADVKYDMAGREANEVRVSGRTKPLAGVTGLLQLRRHRPYFELWTIWGAFSPRGFDEAVLGLVWDSPRHGLSLQARGGSRSYHETSGAGPAFSPLRSDGWRAEADAFWRSDGALAVFGRYALEIGFGESREEADAGIRVDLGEHFFAGLNGSVFQNVRELRLEQGTVWGGGADAGVRLGENLRLAANAFAYRHNGGAAGSLDWTQRRGTIRAEWALGRDPGTRGRR